MTMVNVFNTISPSFVKAIGEGGVEVGRWHIDRCANLNFKFRKGHLYLVIEDDEIDQFIKTLQSTGTYEVRRDGKPLLTIIVDSTIVVFEYDSATMVFTGGSVESIIFYLQGYYYVPDTEEYRIDKQKERETYPKYKVEFVKIK